MAKDILVPSIRWDSSCFAKTLPNQPCSFTAPMGTKCLVLQEISNLELAWLSCCSKKKSWRWTCSPWQNITSTAACSSFTGSLVVFLPQPSPVIHFLCPIPEVASAEMLWKITLGWKPMQIYVFGFFFFLPLWAAFDLKSSFLSQLRCWSRDQGLAEGSYQLAPGRTFGPNSARVLGSCLLKIHLMLSSPWKLSLREVWGWFIFLWMVIPNFSCVWTFSDRRWSRMAAQSPRNSGVGMSPHSGVIRTTPVTNTGQLRGQMIHTGFVTANHSTS